MRQVGRGQKVRDAPPVQGTIAFVADGAGPVRLPQPANGGTDGVVALVRHVGADVLEPLHGSLAAILCMDEEPDDGFARSSRALGVPCLYGVTFDGDVPADGSLVLVDCSHEEEGLVLVVDGGAGEVEPAVADQVT